MLRGVDYQLTQAAACDKMFLMSKRKQNMLIEYSHFLSCSSPSGRRPRSVRDNRWKLGGSFSSMDDDLPQCCALRSFELVTRQLVILRLRAIIHGWAIFRQEPRENEGGFCRTERNILTPVGYLHLHASSFLFLQAEHRL